MYFLNQLLYISFYTTSVADVKNLRFLKIIFGVFVTNLAKFGLCGMCVNVEVVHPRTGCQNWHPNWVRLAANGTHLGP